MNVSVKHEPSLYKVVVRKVGLMQGLAESWIRSLRLAHMIDRAASRGHRIKIIGGDKD